MRRRKMMKMTKLKGMACLQDKPASMMIAKAQMTMMVRTMKKRRRKKKMMKMTTKMPMKSRPTPPKRRNLSPTEKR